MVATIGSSVLVAGIPMLVVLLSVSVGQAQGAVVRSSDDPRLEGIRRFALDPVQADRVLAACQWGLFVSEDGGLTWTRAEPDDFITDVVLAPSEPSLVYATGGRERVYRSRDGGDNWEEAYRFAGGHAVSAVDVHPIEPDIVVVGQTGVQGRGIQITDDGWTTFRWLAPDQSVAVWDVSFAGANGQWLLVVEEGHLRRFFSSGDGGLTWQREETVEPSIRYIGRVGEMVYVLRRRDERITLFRAPAETLEWEEIQLGEHAMIGGSRPFATADPQNPSRIVVAMGHALILSEDDGATWEAIAPGPAIYAAFDPHVPGRLWYASRDTLASVNLPVSSEPLTGPAREPELERPFPNPSFGSATLAFDLPVGATISIAVYDVLGRRMAHLVDGPFSTGRHEVSFSSSALPGGVYLIRMVAASDDGHSRVSTQRLTVTR